MNRKIIFIFPLFLFCGCVATTSQTSIDELKKEVSKLQLKCASLETKQAEMYSKFEENLVDNDTANASIQELYKKMTKISQDLKDLEITVKNQKNDSTKAIPLPSKLYENAYNDFLLGKYEVAVMGFQSFLKQYKDHDLAVQAQYYIAESMYSQGKFKEAYEEYKKVGDLYSNSEFLSAARLKMALCLEQLGRKDDSVVVLQSIIKDYPKSAEAFTAKEKIKIYTNDKKSK
ncbi:MAG: tetratricopeptide repeat protein [Endomicrobiaceae bacterium]|nr:tetratricopeptide repeat protein [Endomicrobiaceae bacterium]